jgi:hypothetical protein
MKKLMTTVTGAAIGLLFAVNAGAATIWQPTDGNVNVLQIGPLGGELALFEDTDALTGANALTLGSDGGIFEFTDNLDGSFTVEALVGGILQGVKSMNGNEFVLAVNWGSGYVADSSAQQNPSDPTTFALLFDDGVTSGQSIVVDIAEVPLPAAAWLFMSALMGVTGAKVRNRARRLTRRHQGS